MQPLKQKTGTNQAFNDNILSPFLPVLSRIYYFHQNIADLIAPNILIIETSESRPNYMPGTMERVYNSFKVCDTSKMSCLQEYNIQIS